MALSSKRESEEYQAQRELTGRAPTVIIGPAPQDRYAATLPKGAPSTPVYMGPAENAPEFDDTEEGRAKYLEWLAGGGSQTPDFTERGGVASPIVVRELAQEPIEFWGQYGVPAEVAKDFRPIDMTRQEYAGLEISGVQVVTSVEGKAPRQGLESTAESSQLIVRLSEKPRNLAPTESPTDLVGVGTGKLPGAPKQGFFDVFGSVFGSGGFLNPVSAVNNPIARGEPLEFNRDPLGYSAGKTLNILTFASAGFTLGAAPTVVKGVVSLTKTAVTGAGASVGVSQGIKGVTGGGWLTPDEALLAAKQGAMWNVALTPVLAPIMGKVTSVARESLPFQKAQQAINLAHLSKSPLDKLPVSIRVMEKLTGLKPTGATQLVDMPDALRGTIISRATESGKNYPDLLSKYVIRTGEQMPDDWALGFTKEVATNPKQYADEWAQFNKIATKDAMPDEWMQGFSKPKAPPATAAETKFLKNITQPSDMPPTWLASNKATPGIPIKQTKVTVPSIKGIEAENLAWELSTAPKSSLTSVNKIVSNGSGGLGRSGGALITSSSGTVTTINKLASQPTITKAKTVFDAPKPNAKLPAIAIPKVEEPKASTKQTQTLTIVPELKTSTRQSTQAIVENITGTRTAQPPSIFAGLPTYPGSRRREEEEEENVYVSVPTQSPLRIPSQLPETRPITNQVQIPDSLPIHMPKQSPVELPKVDLPQVFKPPKVIPDKPNIGFKDILRPKPWEDTKPILSPITAPILIPKTIPKITPKTISDTVTKDVTRTTMATPVIPKIPKLSFPKYPAFNLGFGKGGKKTKSDLFGTWYKRKHPIKTYGAMLKTFGIGGKDKAMPRLPTVNTRNLYAEVRKPRRKHRR